MLKVTKNGDIFIDGKYIKPFIGKDGYKRVFIGKHCRTAHRVVAEYYYGPIWNGLTVDHLNGDRLDNRPENLQIVTRQENHKRAGIMEKPIILFNIDNQILGIFGTIGEASKRLGISRPGLKKAIKIFPKPLNGGLYVKEING